MLALGRETELSGQNQAFKDFSPFIIKIHRFTVMMYHGIMQREQELGSECLICFILVIAAAGLIAIF